MSSGDRESPDGPVVETVPPAVAPDPDRHVHVCERCGSVMEEIHCKIMCKTCGYFRDCSDP